MAGKIEGVLEQSKANKVAVVIEPAEWTFTADQLADAVEKVVRIHRGFFNDHSDPGSW